MTIGMYVGIWIMFVGGVVDILNQVKTTETNTTQVAIGIAKIVFFEVPIGLGLWLAYGFARYPLRVKIKPVQYYS